MVWILSGPGYVGHHMKSYMKYTLKNSPLSCTVMQIWSFSVMKFMLKCLRSCPNKIIESGRVVIYAAHYTCSNVDLNLILVAARTSGFIFQIVDSLMASRGVHLTWHDCIPKRYPKHTIEKRGGISSLYYAGVLLLLLLCVVHLCNLYIFYLKQFLIWNVQNKRHSSLQFREGGSRVKVTFHSSE